MAEIACRFCVIAGTFTETAQRVPDDAWDNPAPCEGWVARDVVGHLVEWLPAFFFGTWDIQAPVAPTVDVDPVGAWDALNRTIQAALDDPETADAERDNHMGRTTF